MTYIVRDDVVTVSSLSNVVKKILAFNQHWKRIPFSWCRKWGSANIFR